jgi:hypothetical protein
MGGTQGEGREGLLNSISGPGCRFNRCATCRSALSNSLMTSALFLHLCTH